MTADEDSKWAEELARELQRCKAYMPHRAAVVAARDHIAFRREMANRSITSFRPGEFVEDVEGGALAMTANRTEVFDINQFGEVQATWTERATE